MMLLNSLIGAKMYKRKSRAFVCKICGKDFHKEGQLKRHVRDAHEATGTMCKLVAAPVQEQQETCK